MKVTCIDLANAYDFLEGGKLDCYCADYPSDGDGNEWKRPAVIVVPGGAYWFVSKREGEPVALAFLAKGFQTFVLNYLCVYDKVRYPEQLLELSAAVDYVKKHADELHVNADEVFVVGFSAGGHLTGNLAVDYAASSQKAGAVLDCKPTAVGLCYPVISDKLGHMASHNFLLEGYTDEAKAELLPSVRLDEMVTEQTPPAFLWTTTTDATVPSINALSYAMALAKVGISYELHVFPEGPHGMSTGSLEINEPCAALPYVSRWVGDCATFFRRFTKEQY